MEDKRVFIAVSLLNAARAKRGDVLDVWFPIRSVPCKAPIKQTSTTKRFPPNQYSTISHLMVSALFMFTESQVDFEICELRSSLGNSMCGPYSLCLFEQDNVLFPSITVFKL